MPSSGGQITARVAAARGEAPRAGRPSALEQARARSRTGWDKALETFTVGSAADEDCDFNDLQSAIAAAAANGSSLDFILVARNQSYTGVALTIDSQDLAIFGGYDDCADRTPDGDTTLTGSTERVFEISGVAGAGVSYGVTLRDLVIQQGDATVTDLAGGGLYIYDGVQVDLDSSTVRNNDAIFGGGIAIDDSVLVLLPGTLVHGNDAAEGGGIFCQRSSVEVRGQSSIFDNEATVNGGGINANDCTVESRAGPVGIFTLGIVLNDAGSRGGGCTGDVSASIRASSSAMRRDWRWTSLRRSDGNTW